jgi:hypothetical protein
VSVHLKIKSGNFRKATGSQVKGSGDNLNLVFSVCQVAWIFPGLIKNNDCFKFLVVPFTAKKLRKLIILIGLKATKENSRIRIQIQIKYRSTGPDPYRKHHGFGNIKFSGLQGKPSSHPF